MINSDGYFKTIAFNKLSLIISLNVCKEVTAFTIPIIQSLTFSLKLILHWAKII